MGQFTDLIREKVADVDTGALEARIREKRGAAPSGPFHPGNDPSLARAAAPSPSAMGGRQFNADKGEQLKMFMTPHEIHAQYQPLDADREDSYGSTVYKTAPSDYTGGSRQTYDSEGNYARRTEGGTRISHPESQESDEELYSRKLDEAAGYSDYGDGRMVGGKSSAWSGETYHPSRDTTGGGHESSWESPMRYHPGEEGMTLHDAIGEQGVLSPVRLGSETGSMGKPQIVGGHHRLASATEHASYGNWGHQFVPVLHHQNIGEARSGPTTAAWKYT